MSLRYRQALQDIADYPLLTMAYLVAGDDQGEVVLFAHADMLRTLAKEALKKC